MIRIGLTQRVVDLLDRDERRDCLDQRWSRLLTEIGMIPIPVANQVADLETYLSGLDVHGFIFTGGNDLSGIDGATDSAPERDATEKRILSWATVSDVPVLGVCRGMQMMIADGGGSLKSLDGHVAVRHGLCLRGDSPMPLSDRDEVNSFHRFGVSISGLGSQWRAVACAPDGSVEAAVHSRLRRWAVMWHPERAPFDPRDVEIIKTLFTEEAR